MESAEGFMRGAEFMAKDGRPKHAAFLLHQAAEQYITCLLLVYTGYKPKEHDLEKLLAQAAAFDPRFTTVFPRSTSEEEHLFDLLRRAYVDARYSKSYRIAEEELKAIWERIEALKALTAEVCGNRVEDLRSSAKPREKS